MSKDAEAKWDIVRFFTTLNTFGEIPFLGSFRWMQEWIGQRQAFPGTDFQTMDKTVVVLGSIPQTAVAALNQIAPSIKISPCDWKNSTYQISLEEKHTLCKLTKSADTLLIWQVSDFSNLVTTLGECLGENSEIVTQTVFDFTQTSTDLAAWGALDDVVMGGVSEGAFIRSSQADLACALFTGNVSTNNSGGFSSVRSQNFEPPYRFGGWRGLQIKVRGDGQRYKFILRNSAGWDSLAYIYGFDTVADEWMEVTIPFDQMVPTFRAKSMSNAPAFDPTRVISFQLMLSKFEYDGRLNPQFRPGPFKLAIANISAYRDRQGVPLVVVGSTEEAERQQQQAILTESNIYYRFIETHGSDISSDISDEALVESVKQALS